MTASAIAPDQYPKFRALWADKKMRLARLANIFNCSESTITETARRLELSPKHKSKKGPVDCCRNCRFNSLEWCRANPYAEQLPCELEPTPATHEWREMSVYHSPNGFWDGDRRSEW